MTRGHQKSSGQWPRSPSWTRPSAKFPRPRRHRKPSFSADAASRKFACVSLRMVRPMGLLPWSKQASLDCMSLQTASRRNEGGALVGGPSLTRISLLKATEPFLSLTIWVSLRAVIQQWHKTDTKQKKTKMTLMLTTMRMHGWLRLVGTHLTESLANKSTGRWLVMAFRQATKDLGERQRQRGERDNPDLLSKVSSPAHEKRNNAVRNVPSTMTNGHHQLLVCTMPSHTKNTDQASDKNICSLEQIPCDIGNARTRHNVRFA